MTPTGSIVKTKKTREILREVEAAVVAVWVPEAAEVTWAQRREEREEEAAGADPGAAAAIDQTSSVAAEVAAAAGARVSARSTRGTPSGQRSSRTRG